MLCAQVVHAAGESAAFHAPPEGTHAIVLAALEPELRRLVEALRREGIRCVAVYEDAPPYENALMAIGVEPLDPNAARWLKHLPLLREVKPPG